MPRILTVECVNTCDACLFGFYSFCILVCAEDCDKCLIKFTCWTTKPDYSGNEITTLPEAEVAKIIKNLHPRLLKTAKKTAGLTAILKNGKISTYRVDQTIQNIFKEKAK